MLSKVIISGGGTGGHIFPAIAIADCIKQEFPECEILFIGAEGKMEMKRVPEAGYKIIGLPIRGLQRKLTLKNLALPFKILASLRKAKQIIQEFKPDVVVGVGGYASAPTLYKANQLKIPTVIQEQNSFPGKTNQFLAKKVAKICVAYKKLEQFFPKEKIVFTGNPIRRKVVQIEGKKEEAIRFFDLNPNRKVVLVVGGSLGSKTLNESCLSGFKSLQKEDVQLIWQSGRAQYKEMKRRMKQENKLGIKLFDFIREMELAYAVADVIISRAGAIAISELCVIGKPVILVPSPNVAEDHQTKNAMALVEENAALYIKDSEAREKLIPNVIQLLKDSEKSEQLSKNIKNKGIIDADERIVSAIKEVVN